MTRQPSNSSFASLVVAIVLVVLLPAYMGAYYAMLEGKIVWYYPNSFTPPKEADVEPEYRVKSDRIDAIFQPAHYIDRKLRPSYWAE